MIDNQGRLRINADVLLTSNTNPNTGSPAISKHISVARPSDDYHAANKLYVDELVSQIPKFSILVVDTLPSTPGPGVIYLLKSTSTQSQNLYDEYIYIGNSAYSVTFYYGESGSEKVSTRPAMQYVNLYQAETFAPNTYYRNLNPMGTPDYLLLTTEPSDWSTNYRSYYKHIVYGTIRDIHGGLNVGSTSPIKVVGYDSTDTALYTYNISAFYPSAPGADITALHYINECAYIEITWDDISDIPVEGAVVNVSFSGTGWEKLGSQSIDISGKMDKFGTYAETTVGNVTTGTITPTADKLVIPDLQTTTTPTDTDDVTNKAYVDNYETLQLNQFAFDYVNGSSISDNNRYIRKYLANPSKVKLTVTFNMNNQPVVVPLSAVVETSSLYQFRFLYIMCADAPEHGIGTTPNYWLFLIDYDKTTEQITSKTYKNLLETSYIGGGADDNAIPTVVAVKNYVDNAVSQATLEWGSLS